MHSAHHIRSEDGKFLGFGSSDLTIGLLNAMNLSV